MYKNLAAMAAAQPPLVRELPGRTTDLSVEAAP